MDTRGFKKLQAVLSEIDLIGECMVHPEPQPEEDVRFLAIQCSNPWAGGLMKLLNVLDTASMIERQGAMNAGASRKPTLRVLSILPNGIAFEDVEARPQRNII